MQHEISEQLLTSYVTKTPTHNKPNKTITWAPRKEKFNLDNADRFCRRCSPNGEDCDCIERLERNAQRCLNFCEKDESGKAELNMEFTPYSSRTQFHGQSMTKPNRNAIGNTTNIKECDFLPRLNSKRKLLYANAVQN